MAHRGRPESLFPRAPALRWTELVGKDPPSLKCQLHTVPRVPTKTGSELSLWELPHPHPSTTGHAGLEPPFLACKVRDGSHARVPSAGPVPSAALHMATRSQMFAVATTVDEAGVTFRVRELGVLTCFVLS